MRMFGAAVGEASRIARAIVSSSRAGLSAQAVTNAPAVERLIHVEHQMIFRRD